jgi:hypothetical protein
VHGETETVTPFREDSRGGFSRPRKEDAMMAPVKDEAKQLLEKLPEDATWDDLMYEIYVKQKVSNGQQAVVDGKVVTHAEARRRVGKK